MSIYDYLGDEMGRWQFEDTFEDLDFTLLRYGEKHLVFAYGTLMTGCRNHARLEHAKLISDNAHTPYTDDYWMSTRMTSAGYPAPVMTRGIAGRPHGAVWGEVWQVDNVTLLALDEAEGHPEVYRREKIRIDYVLPKSGNLVNWEIWAYLYQGEHTDCMDHIAGYNGTADSALLFWKCL